MKKQWMTETTIESPQSPKSRYFKSPGKNYPSYQIIQQPSTQQRLFPNYSPSFGRQQQYLTPEGKRIEPQQYTLETMMKDSQNICKKLEYLRQDTADLRRYLDERDGHLSECIVMAVRGVWPELVRLYRQRTAYPPAYVTMMDELENISQRYQLQQGDIHIDCNVILGSCKVGWHQQNKKENNLRNDSKYYSPCYQCHLEHMRSRSTYKVREANHL